MKRVFVGNLLAILFLSCYLLGFINYNRKEAREFEELRLSYAIDYATDAAISALLETSDLGLDYVDFGAVKTDPQIALDEFVTAFLLNYDMALSEENRYHVKINYMPVFVVASYDGFYLAKPTQIRSDLPYPENPARDVDYDLVFLPKLPYSYKHGTAEYALNLGTNTALKVEGSILTKIATRPPGLNNALDVRAKVNEILTNAIGAILSEANSNDVGWSNVFYLPSNLTTFTSVNPVSGPSVLAMVQNVDITSGQPVSAFSIGGAKIKNARMVAGYIRSGIKYYTYVDKLPSTITPLDLYTSPKDAALAGYAYDMQYME